MQDQNTNLKAKQVRNRVFGYRINSKEIVQEPQVFINSFSEDAIHLQRINAAAWFPYWRGLRMGAVK